MNVALCPEPLERNILSLCAGVGGLELGICLALDYLGKTGRGICYVERECAAAASLVASMEAGWFHQAPIWSDMLTFDARPWRGLVHILASGDPCQDNSVAGKRAGSRGKRFLAPEVCRLADECRPDIIFRENVPGNADGQLAAIVPPLERLGYRVAAGIFSSSKAGNTMRRERLFIMAEREGGAGWLRGSAGWNEGSNTRRGSVGMDGSSRGRHGDADQALWSRWDGVIDASVNVVQPSSAELQGQQPGQHVQERREVKGRQPMFSGGTILPPAVIPGPTDSRWIDLLDRFPELQPAISKEEAESHLRRGVDALAYRTERLRATGNGVDPVVAATAFLSLGTRLGLWAN